MGSSSAQVILLESELLGGTALLPVIQVTGKSHLFARDIKITGYITSVKNDLQEKTSGSISEFSSYDFCATRESKSTIRLPIKNVPVVMYLTVTD